MNDTLSGPDLTKGVALSTVADGAMLLGHAHGEPVLLARRGDELFAIGAPLHALWEGLRAEVEFERTIATNGPSAAKPA